MSDGTSEFMRFKLLDQFFASGKRGTAKELIAFLKEKKGNSALETNFGCSQASLYRVLGVMRNDLGLPLAKDYENRYYYSSGKTLTQPAFLSREATAKTIRMVKSLLETIKDSPVYEEAERLCGEITNEVPLMDQYGKEIREERSAAANRVIFLGAPASDVRDSIWSEIYKAMEGNYHIGIKYVSSGKSQQVSRGVRPYQLIFDDGIWDLWGYDCVKKETRLFNLSRIKSVEIKKNADRFVLPKNYDFHNVTPGTFGCFVDVGGEKMTRYKILLAKGSYAESFAVERVWGKNPSIQKTKDGTIISFDDNQYLPILRWVLGWGPDAEPLEPASLVSDWKKRIKAMARLAGE